MPKIEDSSRSPARRSPLRPLPVNPVLSSAVLFLAYAMLSAPNPARAQAAPVTDKIGSAANFLMLPPDEQPGSFRNTDKLFATRTFKRGTSVYPLPPADAPLTAVSYTMAGKTFGIANFMTRNRVSGLLVIDHGRIALERYGLGNDEKSRWNSFSVGKSIVSTLVGAAVKDGAIASIEDPVTKYIPQLKGSAYDGATVRNLLQMSSGVKWNEDYRQRDSDIGALLKCVAAKTPGCIVGFMSKLPRAAPPGMLFNYNTGETHLIGLIVSAATHKTLSDYLSEKIWSRFGMESDGYWTLESDGGVEMAGGSLGMTLRDYGRFGAFILGDGVVGDAHILPAGWVAEASRPRPDSPQVAFGKLEPDDPDGYGYQWWVLPHIAPHAGAFQAEGIFGQFIYINPKAHIVAVVWSAWPEAWVDKNAIETSVFLGGVVKALTKPLHRKDRR
jgi:CubicO group peptidase (beta-lactamase class C family)